MVIARILAKIDVTVESFAGEWSERKWYESAEEIGKIAQHANAAQQLQGWPIARVQATTQNRLHIGLLPSLTRCRN